MAAVVASHHGHQRGGRSVTPGDRGAERAAVAAIHDLVAQPLSGKPLQTKIENAFERFDEDGNGAIDRDEYRTAMFALGLRRSSADFDKLYSEYDTNGDGQIDLGEFGDMVRSLMKRDKDDDAFHQQASDKGNGTGPPIPSGQKGVHAHVPHAHATSHAHAPHRSGPRQMEPIPASPSSSRPIEGSSPPSARAAAAGAVAKRITSKAAASAAHSLYPRTPRPPSSIIACAYRAHVPPRPVFAAVYRLRVSGPRSVGQTPSLAQ
jgi:hypothetical protein